MRELSDEEIALIRSDYYAMAQLAFEAWQHEQENGSKNPVGLSPTL